MLTQLVGMNLLRIKPEKETQRAPQHLITVAFTLGHNGTNVEELATLIYWLLSVQV